MQFEEKVYVRKLGEKTGLFVSFLLFSSIFFLILSLLNKIPPYVRYVHIVVGVITIYIVGSVFEVLFGR